MGLLYGIEQERAVPVLCETGVEVGKSIFICLALVHMIGTCSVLINFLHNYYIRILRLNKAFYVINIRREPFLAPCPALCTAVHEEAVIRLICTKARIERDDLISLTCFGFKRSTVLNIKLLMIG